MLPRENGFFIFQLFARSVFKFPPTWEGKSDSEPREARLFDRWCVTRRGTRSFPPDSHFVVQTRIQGMPLLGSRFNRVGSTPRGEHAADLVSRRESGCRWNTRSNAFSFARRWRVFPGFDETFIRLNISRRNITFNDLSSPLALSRSSYYKRISRKKENKIDIEMISFSRIWWYFHEIKFRFVPLFPRV